MMLARLITAAACLLAQDDPAAPAPKLTMTPGIVCETVTGYEDYEKRKDAVLTRDEKLLVYYEPNGYDYALKDNEYRVHLVQDARIRRRGEKKVLQAKDKLLEYKGKFKEPPLNLYLSNVISLKALPPGDYDLEIILHDELSKAPPTSQIVPFRVKPVEEAKEPEPGKDKL